MGRLARDATVLQDDDEIATVDPLLGGVGMRACAAGATSSRNEPTHAVTRLPRRGVGPAGGPSPRASVPYSVS